MKNNEFIIKYTASATKENINYVFERLITPLAIATAFEPYKESWSSFENVLKIVTSWAIVYDQTKDLSKINLNEFKHVDDVLYHLDDKYLNKDGLYAEEAYEWLIQLSIIIKKFYNKE